MPSTSAGGRITGRVFGPAFPHAGCHAWDNKTARACVPSTRERHPACQRASRGAPCETLALFQTFLASPDGAEASFSTGGLLRLESRWWHRLFCPEDEALDFINTPVCGRGLILVCCLYAPRLGAAEPPGISKPRSWCGLPSKTLPQRTTCVCWPGCPVSLCRWSRCLREPVAIYRYVGEDGDRSRQTG